MRPGRAAALLALAIASGCGPRTASPAGALVVPDPGPAQAAPLDEEGCLALAVADPAARSRCEGGRGPCVYDIGVEQIQGSPARHVCFVLTTSENWEEDGEDEMLISTEGTYTLALVESADGAWVVRDTKEYRYWSQEIETEEASITLDTVGPDKTAVVVRERSGMGAYSNDEVTFLLVTPSGLTEIFSFESKVGDEGREERSHEIDDKATTDGHHDIVLSVEVESFEDDGEAGSWEERYRWNGTVYVQVEGKARD